MQTKNIMHQGMRNINTTKETTPRPFTANWKLMNCGVGGGYAAVSSAINLEQRQKGQKFAEICYNFSFYGAFFNGLNCVVQPIDTPN